jgi:putative endopeptidase
MHTDKPTRAMLVTALLCAAATMMCAQVRGEPGVDEAIHPGDDFFAYANGAWLKNTPMPAGIHRWGARAEVNELTKRQVTQLIDDAAAAPAGTDARKVADFRAAYANESAIESRGLASLTPLLTRIDSIHDRPTLTRHLASELRADVDPLNLGIFDSAHLLGLTVDSGSHGEKTYVAFLLQGGLGLPERKQYLDTTPDALALRARYQARIARVLELAGYDHSTQRAEAAMALETAIAQSHATPEASAEDRNADNLWTRADFASRAPGIDWPAFFTAAGLSKQDSFVVWQPTAIEGAAKLVASQPVAVWQDYLRFHVIDRYADALPPAFSDTTSEPTPRAERALEATKQKMSGPLGKLYVERYFSAEQKARMQTIIANVIAAFRARIEGVSWMSPANKAMALAKLKTLYFGVGYPEKWPNYSTLAVSSNDAVGNLRNIEQWNYRAALARIGQPDDHRDWAITPQTSGAVLNFQKNSYNFAAALLQPPRYDPAASDSANYGAIGAIMGHEVAHFLDTLGADYDASGAKVHWWTPEDQSNYQAAVDPLIRQVSEYRPFPDATIDGAKTQVENVADLGGLIAAFDAHRRALGAKAGDPAYVRQMDRQFFIGFAGALRSKYDEAGMRKQLDNDHAPETYRVSTVRNMDAWYEAFDVQPGQRLYLEPKARVRIW